MRFNKKVLSVLIATALSLSLCSTAFAEYYVTSLYGGNLDDSDVTEFANAMDGLSGWSKSVVDTTATVKQLIDADDTSTFVYWSGHGLYPSGKFSCYGYNYQTTYINYDAPTAPIMHSYIGSSAPVYNSGMPGSMSNSCWNSNVRYVVLAACNQIGKDSTLTDYWSHTMYGNYRRVNMIFGYAGNAPASKLDEYNDFQDNLIARKFVANMKAGQTIRNAWYNANTLYGISYSTILYNSIASSDKITSMSSISWYNNAHPTIYLEKNNVKQSGVYSTNLPAVIIDSAENLKKTKVKKIGALEIFDRDKFNDFSISNESEIELSIDKINKYLSKNGYLPKDAEFDSITIRESTPIHTCEEEPQTEILKSYVVNYRQKYNNKKVSNLANGSYLNVYIENGKITDLVKNWLELDSMSESEYNTQNLISSKKAVEKANSKLLKGGWDSIPQLKSVEVVYSKNNMDELMPMWEIKYDGITLQVDCSTEDIF